MRFRVLLAAFCFFAVGAGACLNDYQSNEKAREFFGPLTEGLKKESLIEPWAVRAARLQKEGGASPTLENRNDLAVALLHLKKTGEAIVLLEQIEKESPGKYQTATNLGTAYELAGRNDEALWWIEEGVRRNAASHQGSEWIHIAILQKKIEFAQKGVPAELNSILGIPEKRGAFPRGNDGKIQSLDQVMDAIKAQLKERLPFVPAPDFYVASLLWDLGRLYERKTREPGAGQQAYRMAMDYLGDAQSNDLRAASLGAGQHAAGRVKSPRSFWLTVIKSAPIALVIWSAFSFPSLPIAFCRNRKNIRAAFSEILGVLAVTAAIVVPPWMGMTVLYSIMDEGLSDLAITLFIFGTVFLTAMLIRIVHRSMQARFPSPARAAV